MVVLCLVLTSLEAEFSLKLCSWRHRPAVDPRALAVGRHWGLSRGWSADWLCVWEGRGPEECGKSSFVLSCGLDTAFEPQTHNMSFLELAHLF